MKMRKLGRTGLEVSEICLGTMQFGWTVDETQSFAILDAAYAGGVNFFDTANIYFPWVPSNRGGVTECILGRWLKTRGIPRESVILTATVGGQMSSDPANQGLSHAHIIKAADVSLRRMQTEYIDLYQARWFYETTDIEETLRAFQELVKAGKVRTVGCSNYPCAGYIAYPSGSD